MPGITIIKESDFEDTTNGIDILRFYEWNSRRVRDDGYLTRTDKDPSDPNQFDYSDTQKGEEEDLAPETSLREAAQKAKIFIESLPEDLIDADLGTGL